MRVSDNRHIDKALSRIAGEIDLYSRLTPVNRSEQKYLFFSELQKGKHFDPVYKYSTRGLRDPEAELLDIREAALLPGYDPFRNILIRKSDALRDQCRMLKCQGKDISAISSRLFGKPEKEDVEFSERILCNTSREVLETVTEDMTAREMRDALSCMLQEKGISGWEVSFSDNIVSKLSVSGALKRIFVNPRFSYAEQELQRLKVHEIEVHVYRAMNGMLQGLDVFREGTAGYDGAEEGLAVYAEQASGCLEIDLRQYRFYAGRCIAVHKALQSSFFDTFLHLKHFFPDEFAFRLTERAKRGMTDTSIPGAFTKDSCYIKGLNCVKQYLREKREHGIKILFTGKVGFRDIEDLEILSDEGLLKPPEYCPGFLKKGR
jgi:uncharacterized protein (TIGR02421 family)